MFGSVHTNGSAVSPRGGAILRTHTREADKEQCSRTRHTDTMVASFLLVWACVTNKSILSSPLQSHPKKIFELRRIIDLHSREPFSHFQPTAPRQEPSDDKAIVVRWGILPAIQLNTSLDTYLTTAKKFQLLLATVQDIWWSMGQWENLQYVYFYLPLVYCIAVAMSQGMFHRQILLYCSREIQ